MLRIFTMSKYKVLIANIFFFCNLNICKFYIFLITYFRYTYVLRNTYEYIKAEIYFTLEYLLLI